MKKAGIANAPRPSLEAPGESVNHTSVILSLFLLPKLRRTIRLMIFIVKEKGSPEKNCQTRRDSLNMQSP
jgi:hypothetical protein